MQVHFTYDVEIWIDGWTDMGARLVAALRRFGFGLDGQAAMLEATAGRMIGGGAERSSAFQRELLGQRRHLASDGGDRGQGRLQYQCLFRIPVNAQGHDAPDQNLPTATLVSLNFETISVDCRSEHQPVTRRFARMGEWLCRNTALFPTASFDPSVVPAKSAALRGPGRTLAGALRKRQG